MGMMRMIIVLACALLLVGDVNAQTDKKAKKTRKQAKGELIPLPVARSAWVYVDAKGNELTPEQAAQLGRPQVAIPQPEPLIGIHYLLEYPKEAQAAQVQGTVTYTVKVREGKVIDAKIERPDHMYLTTAVLEAANKLQFDQSWHEPNEPEFTYTRSVEFTLPDQIHSLMPPLILEKQ
jgi:TonB family protein